MFGSLKSAYDLAKDLTTLQVGAEFKSKITDLLAQLLTAREDAAALQDQNFALAAEIRDLKLQAQDKENWATESSRYELRSLEGGAVGYVLKKSERRGEGAHALCPQCFSGGRKGFFQPAGPPANYRLVEHRCSACGTRAAIGQRAIAEAWGD